MNASDSVSGIIDSTLQSRWDSGESRTTVLYHLFEQQVQDGLMPRRQINGIQIKETFQRDSVIFKLQKNYGRVTRGVSTRSHPSPRHTIPFRDGIPCFCCPEVIQYQWPQERGIAISVGDTPLIILPNISPIFVPHFTVISPDHRPQVMDCRRAIELADLLPCAWVIQNGADAGATNPWHYHLQLFFESDLPILKYPKQALGSQLDVLSHPALVIRITGNSKGRFIAAMSDCVDRYLALSDSRRVNLIIRTIDTHWEGYIVLRDTRFKTDLYRSGQPGYAEPAGIISAIDDQSYQIWVSESTDRYTQLMTAIRPTDAQTIQFIKSLA